MALRAPLFLQAVGGDTAISFSAQDFRTLLDGLVVTTGVSYTTDLAVSQRAAGANFSVDVAAGHAVIAGTSVADQGKYMVQNTATLNVTITAGGSATARYDLVYAQVRDKQSDGGSAYDFVIDKVTGTVGAGQVVAAGGAGVATPANAIPLAQIGPVVTGTASITTSLITSLRPYIGPAGAVMAMQARNARQLQSGSVSSLSWTSGVASGSVTFTAPFANTPNVSTGLRGFITSNTPWHLAILTKSTTGFTWEGRADSAYTGTGQPGFDWVATDA
jgi:hypothetical protein